MMARDLALCPLCVGKGCATLLTIRANGAVGDCFVCNLTFARHTCATTFLNHPERWLAFVNSSEIEICPSCGARLIVNETQQGNGGSAIGALICIAAVAFLIYKATEPPPRPRHRPINREQLEVWKKSYVYERDGAHCVYCGFYVALGEEHIDHSVSRKNGGTNHLNNLRLACAPCNLSKGSLNSRQFRSYS